MADRPRWRVSPAHPPPSTLHPPPGQVLRGHTDEVFAVAFHPDGTRLATAGRDGAVWLWDLARGETVVRLPGHKSYVWSLAFSPDGATLASGSGDSTVRLWDTAPLKVRYQARREAAALRPEAERLVEPLWREKNDPAEVVEALRADRRLRARRYATRPCEPCCGGRNRRKPLHTRQVASLLLLHRRAMKARNLYSTWDCTSRPAATHPLPETYLTHSMKATGGWARKSAQYSGRTRAGPRARPRPRASAARAGPPRGTPFPSSPR